MRLFLFITAVLLCTGCSIRQRERALAQKQAEIGRKEQDLLLREGALQVREAALAEKEKRLDSTLQRSPDSLAKRYPDLPGRWSVRMHCTETTCPGSAVGDTKNEQWAFSFSNGTVLVQALSDNRVVRVYTGAFAGNTLELAAQQDPGLKEQGLQMIVRLEATADGQLEGQREIIRPSNCRIIYELELNREQASH